jgi:membrane-bound ClpP family serine protease
MTPGAHATRFAKRGATRLAALIAVVGLTLPQAARADDAPPPGMTVQIPAVITSDVATRLRETVYVPLKRFKTYQARQGPKPPPFKLLCDFNPDGRGDATDDFGACWALAKEIRELQSQGVETRAFVHSDVSRHAVLPVLACGEIVMSADPPARIGRIADSRQEPPGPETDTYEHWLLAGHHFAPAVVQKMYDKAMVLVKVAPVGDVIDNYVDAKTAAAKKLAPIPGAGLGAGEIAFCDFAQAKEFNLLSSQDPQNNLAEALKDFGLPRGAVYPLMEQTIAYRIQVHGDIDAQLKDDLDRRLERALGEKANVLILDLECGGGDDQIAFALGEKIVSLKTRADRPIKTIAYVSSAAKDTSAFLALACDEIVMQKDAVFGGDFEDYLKEHGDRVAAIRQELKTTAEHGYYPTALAEGLANPDIHVVQEQSGAILTWEEWNAQHKDHNETPTDVKPAGSYLKLGADDARKYGVAQKVVDDYNDLCTQENIKPAEIGGDWLNGLADFLCNPWTSILLVMIGVTCLILELKMPGASFPGVIAAVCFVLFFWSQSQLHGQIAWLAVLLFILGLVLIGIEVFLFPGTVACGVGGALLTVCGLALVAFGHWPQTGEDWLGFGKQVGPFSISIVVAVMLAFTVARHLKHIPILNRLILKPPGEGGAEGEGEASAPEPVQPELAALLGAIGVAATPLRPAGKTQFGDQFVDVVAEGGFIQPGARVQVIEIEGNRVVVKEV